MQCIDKVLCIQNRHDCSNECEGSTDGLYAKRNGV